MSDLEPTLREKVDSMPMGDERNIMEAALVLQMLGFTPDSTEKTPWHLTPDFTKFRNLVGDTGRSIERSLDSIRAHDATETAALRKVRDEMAITLAELQTNAINHTDLTHLACGRLATDVYVQLAELNAILKERE